MEQDNFYITSIPPTAPPPERHSLFWQVFISLFLKSPISYNAWGHFNYVTQKGHSLSDLVIPPSHSDPRVHFWARTAGLPALVRKPHPGIRSRAYVYQIFPMLITHSRRSEEPTSCAVRCLWLVLAQRGATTGWVQDPGSSPPPDPPPDSPRDCPSCGTLTPPPSPCRPGLRSGGNGQGGASSAAKAKAGTPLLPGPSGSSHPGSRRDRGGSGGGGGGRAGAAARGADPAVLGARRAARERRRQPGTARTVSPALGGGGHAAPGAGMGAAADFG